MPYVTLPDLTPGSAEWLLARRSGVGGSDAPKVCGVSPYATPLHVWLNKVHGHEEDAALRFRLGNLMEPVVATLYAEANGVELRTSPMLRDADRPWQLVNLDRVRADTKRAVEIKTSARFDGWGPPGSDSVPMGYFVQVQHQLDVYPDGGPEADLAALLGGSDFRQYTIAADARVQARVRQICADFWGMVERQEMPDPDFKHEATAELVPLLCAGPEHAGRLKLAADSPLWATVARWEELKKQRSDLEKQADALKTELMFAMTGYGVASLPDGTFLRKKLVRRAPHHVKASEFFTLSVTKKDN